MLSSVSQDSTTTVLVDLAKLMDSIRQFSRSRVKKNKFFQAPHQATAGENKTGPPTIYRVGGPVFITE